jgi:hypothetical protein
MAMDYLLIQASAVPCEHIFSSSAKTDTKRRNRLSPVMMEALQMLKFHLKKSHLNFMKDWATSEKQLVQDDADDADDPLAKLLWGNVQNNMDQIMELLVDLEDED